MENNTKIDLLAVQEALEPAFNWQYVEMEGESSLRFDWGNENSIWVHATGSVSGQKPPKANRISLILKDLGCTQFDWEGF